jgi:catechol-2,3-dioxygenase
MIGNLSNLAAADQGGWPDHEDEFVATGVSTQMSTQQNEKQHPESPRAFIVGFWGVRYQVKDVQRALTFYTQTLGFNLDMQNLPAFGQVSIGGLKLILSGPGASVKILVLPIVW